MPLLKKDAAYREAPGAGQWNDKKSHPDSG
jgi:hypothetical protein